jgi:hypothetical protein
MEENIKIQDNSGDKKYFTIIPNYILNHSTANDQALYLQMKRLAGENGECIAGIRYLMKQMGVGYKAVQKSIKYLIKHKWIEYTGKRTIKTLGGQQKVNSYQVNNIWNLNNKYFQGVAESKYLNSQGVSESKSRCSQKAIQGVAESEQKKELIKKEHIRKKREEKITPFQEMKLFLEDESYFNKLVDYLVVKKELPEDLVKSELKKFKSYWTELNKSGNKQRWQNQSHFELKRRLATWFDKAQEYNQSKISKIGIAI